MTVKALEFGSKRMLLSPLNVLTTKRIFSETPGTLLCRNISVRIIVHNQNRTEQFRVCSISACLVYSAAGLSLSIRITPEEDWRLEIIYLSCISTWKMHLKCGVAKLIFSHCEESERDCFLLQSLVLSQNWELLNFRKNSCPASSLPSPFFDSVN